MLKNIDIFQRRYFTIRSLYFYCNFVLHFYCKSLVMTKYTSFLNKPFFFPFLGAFLYCFLYMEWNFILFIFIFWGRLPWANICAKLLIFYMWDACHSMAWKMVHRSESRVLTGKPLAAKAEHANLTAMPLGRPCSLFFLVNSYSFLDIVLFGDPCLSLPKFTQLLTFTMQIIA